MDYNKDIIPPLLLYSTNYTTSHTLAHCDSNDSRNDEQIITESSGEPKEREKYKQSRWNPTPEQMMALEEVYSSVTRTPTTQQIQEIASKLQKYGRIEGKNVFYWFQNHKSRDRLKRRRPDQQGVDDMNNDVHEEPLRKDNVVIATGNTDSSSSVLRKRSDHRVIHTKTCFSSLPTHQQNNDGRREEYERGLGEKEEEVKWQNQIDPINASDSNSNYHVIITSKSWQEAEHQYNLNEEEEETRKSRTLNLFPVIENQEKTDATSFADKNPKPNLLCCNYYYYYEFMPLLN
ncbi:unnamed protein product [Thlaspi arvense]|uniref:Homeobox domain-containing protein n=1 Tax=Thlaspi arvense TaxID=13288 RepID=A0AAU9RBI4_THLAR|nr:unnamed protein product [Thlaspi arvense]